MGKSDSTPSSPSRYEYRVTRSYSAHAETTMIADEMFNNAENHYFDDNIILASEMIERIETKKDGGERRWIWNTQLLRWEITKYTLD